jgi:murein DD-endopeptidase MepM/ murein hydrolase activator NlpD
MARSREIEKMILASKPKPARPSPKDPAYQAPPQASGALTWPAPSTYVTSSYGYRNHPIFGTSRFHSGVDIAADYGDPIAAADSGTVIYSDWMSGYGYTVIIDHGNGISTLYAHNSSLYVGNGQYVNKGQQIAGAGSTGYSTGPHLHFEVRVNGSTINPMSYF